MYRKRPQNFWGWWRFGGHQSGNVMALVKKLAEDPGRRFQMARTTSNPS